MVVRSIFNLAFIFLTLFSTFQLKAQSDASHWEPNSFFKIGIGASVGLTPRQSQYNYGLGIDLNAQHKLTEEISLMATAGYRRLLTKDTSPLPDLDFLPSLIGVKIFPFGDIFIDGAVGIAFALNKEYHQAFIYSSGLGFELNREIDLSIRYEGYQLGLYTLADRPWNGQFAFRFVYYFKL